jgi:hypothetical protein
MALRHNPERRRVAADFRRQRLYKLPNIMLLSGATLGLLSQSYRFLPQLVMLWEPTLDCKGMSLRPRRTEPVKMSILQKETPLGAHGRNSENSLIELEQTYSLDRTLGGTPCRMKA